jgi:hypothetical protein
MRTIPIYKKTWPDDWNVLERGGPAHAKERLSQGPKSPMILTGNIRISHAEKKFLLIQ